MDELPLFPLRTVLFPDGLLELKIFEARYLDLMTRCMLGKEACQILEAFAQRCAPPAEGVETGGERWRHQAAARGFGPW